MINTSKIKVGDTITVQLIVGHVDNGTINAGPVDWTTRHNINDYSCIVGHTPKPPEIRVGTKYTYAHDKSIVLYRVLHIEGNHLMVKGNSTPFLCELSTLVSGINSGLFTIIDEAV